MGAIKLGDLSAEQRKELIQQAKLEEQRKEEQKKQERKTYKELVGNTVDEYIKELQKVSNALSLSKMNTFKQFESLLEMKQELYDVKSDQQSHTFSNSDNTVSITIGYRQLDRFDDTVNEGVAMVREYMDSLAKDEDSAKLVKMINNLLKRDKQGNLKANRVIELQNFANEVNAEKLKEGVKIILNAYKPERSAYFIDAKIKNGVGGWCSVPLSVSAADFPSGFEAKF